MNDTLQYEKADIEEIGFLYLWIYLWKGYLQRIGDNYYWTQKYLSKDYENG